MVRKGFVKLLCALILTGLGLGTGAAAAQPVTGFTADFNDRLEDCTLSNKGRNDYFSLNPGDHLLLEGDDDGEAVAVLITVLNKTRAITLRVDDDTKLRIKARVVEERETVDGELVEVSRNYFARCEETNDIYYFGEAVDIYEEGEIVSHDGAWLAGKGGARPGIIMPGSFLLGSRYFQEIAPGVALDRAEHMTSGLRITVPAGTFEDCVEIIETSPLDEPGHQSRKVYCPEVGLVIDSSAELVEFDVDEGEDD